MARPRTFSAVLIVVAIAAAAVAGGCGGSDAGAQPSAPSTIPQPSAASMAAASLDKIPVAPSSDRVDITAPTFSNPTEITNPLFPISDLHSVIFSGRIDGKPFHTETTLLPETQLVEWSPGQQVETRVSQYFAYVDGRIEEVALDHYAQADDGSVWYFGEDLYDYGVNGLVDSTEGAWLAGRDGPPAMIMPGDPQVGDVHRAENIPALAFEEVAIKTVGKTVDGPTGPVGGAMVARELHDDGTYSDKIFAPGYGEFYSAHGGEIEPLALAVPTDAVDGPPPAELKALSSAARDAFDGVQLGDWTSAASSKRVATRAWATYSQSGAPPRLTTEMDRALENLAAAINARDRAQAGTAAIDVAQSALDFELRYRPPAEIDLARFELSARQVIVDAAAGDLGGVRGDVATMEWTRDRFAPTLAAADRTAIDAHLVVLRDPVANGNQDLAAASAEATRLEQPLALQPVPLRD